MGTNISDVPVPPGSGEPAAQGSGPLGTPRNILACIGLTIITLGIYAVVWVWRTHEEIKRRSGNGVGGWLGLVIYLVISPVTLFLIPHEIKQMYTREGETSPVGVWLGLWNLLPLIGQIVWFVKVQRALNHFWESHAAAG
jgi:cytosine/uracil/thiamine/allantoin permease